MERPELAARIRELCTRRNDREVSVDLPHGGRTFHIRYVFLTETDLYVTDKLNVFSLSELDEEAVRLLASVLRG